MTRRNLTIQLDDDVIRRAKVVAARHGTSVSALVADLLNRMVERDSRYEEAREVALKNLRSPISRGKRAWTREELYDRPALRRG